MGLFIGERGRAGITRARTVDTQPPEEVRSGSLKDFARRVAKHPGFTYQPNGNGLVRKSQSHDATEASRIPEIHVYATPTYNGLEFLVRPATGPRRIVYHEERPQTVGQELEGVRDASVLMQDGNKAVANGEPEFEMTEIDRIRRELPAYHTFLVRGSQLLTELTRLVPNARVSISHGFGAQDVIDKVAADHPEVTAWEEPALPSRERRSS